MPSASLHPSADLFHANAQQILINRAIDQYYCQHYRILGARVILSFRITYLFKTAELKSNQLSGTSLFHSFRFVDLGELKVVSTVFIKLPYLCFVAVICFKMGKKHGKSIFLKAKEILNMYVYMCCLSGPKLGLINVVFAQSINRHSLQ